MSIQTKLFDSASAFLNKLSASARNELFSIAEIHHFSNAELIFRAGMASEYVYLLKSGRVKIYELSSQGKEVILWFCLPGEIFGLSEITRGAKRSVFAQAYAATEVLLIERLAFNEYLKRHTTASMATIDLLSSRLRGLSGMLSNLTSDNVTSRIIKLLIRMSSYCGMEKQDMLHLNMHLTHQEIADMIGASRQTVSSILGQLKRDGLIHVEKHNIQINLSCLPEHLYM